MLHELATVATLHLTQWVGVLGESQGQLLNGDQGVAVALTAVVVAFIIIVYDVLLLL